MRACAGGRGKEEGLFVILMLRRSRMEDEDEALVSKFCIKLSGLPNSTSSENIKDCLCYQCECDVKKVILQGNIAYAFIIVKDIDELLEKNYTIKETLIEVSLYNDQLELQLDTIEVIGDDDTETLKFYFGGKRSGGNRTKSVESVTKVDTNVVHVKFKSVDDAAAVIAQEKHLITGGSQIQVCYARVPDSEKYERDKILIKNIPKQMKQRTLIALIEGCLDLEFKSEFTLNLQAPLALLLFSCHYNEKELQKMAENLASQQINGNYLSADLCDINHSIIVSGISEEKIVGNDLALQLYFETSSSGGGENTVQMLTPTRFKINFKDPSVISEVLKRKHEKLGPNIVVEVYSVLDEINESTEEKSKFDDRGEFVLQKETQSAKEKNEESNGFASEHHLPSLLEPPVCQQWDPLILKYVCNRCITSIKNIEEELCVSIEFSDCETISVSPTMASILEWQANALKMLNDVISNVSKETMIIPSEAAAAVYPMLTKNCSEESLEYSLVQGNEVSIAGKIESVKKLKDIVNEMISRIVKEVDELKIDTPEDYAYLKEYMFSLVQKKHPSLSLQCNDNSMTVTARGSVNDVKEFKIVFYQYLSHRKVPVSLCSAAVIFLQSNSGKQVLSDITKEAIVVPYFSSSESTVSNNFSLLCPTEFVPQTEILANSIAQNIIVSHVDIPWEYQTQVAENVSSKFSTIITSLANQYAFSAIVDDNVITLVSTVQDKSDICKKIMNLIEENFMPVPRSIVTESLDPLIAKYVRLNEKDSLESIEKELQVSIDFNDEKNIAVCPSVRSPPDWQTKSEEMMEDIIFSTLTKDNIGIPFEAAGAVYPMVMTFCKDQHLEYDFGQVGNEISIAGKIPFVTQLIFKVEEISNRITKKSDELEVASPEDYIYLKECMFSIMQEKHPSLTMHCNDNRLTVSIVGSVKDVKEFKDIFPEYMSHMKVHVTLPTVAVKFLQTDSGQQVLKTITSDSRVFLYFTTDGINQCLYLLHSNKHASLAEELAYTIKQAITTESCDIPLSFQNQVEGEEYSKFKFNLAEKYSFYSTINENELTVVSTAGDINDVINELISFINEACSVSETINFSKGVWRLFHTELKVEWSEVKKSLEAKGIDIVSSKPDTSKPYVVIRGETKAVQEAKEDILSHQVSVESKKIILSQAGVYSYFLSNNALILKGIENAAGVCIEVEVKGMSPNVFKEVFTGVTKEMMSVCVVVGDLTEFNQAEVIVNAANEELKHKGGVAAAIARKGGPSIQQESIDYIRKNKKVATGTAVHFTATGNLPSSFKAIVHAVGPRYHVEDKQNSCATLKQAIFQSLELAKNYESIAFPAIGGGSFGFPIAVCANIHFEAVVEFSKTELPTKLRKVYFVIIEENVEVFLQAAKNYLSDILLEQPPTFESLSPLSIPHLVPNASSASSVLPTLTTVAAQQYPKRKYKKHKASYNVPELGTSLEYIKISQGSIIDYPEEALVNTTDENLKLEGHVSKVLLKEAGPDLKKECDALMKPFKTGSVVATKAYKLRNSKHVLHVILPNYDRKSEGVLREVVQNCLDECTRLKVKSLSMPSIGAGNLKYPPDIVARVLIEETVSFFQKNNGKTTLELVHFVIYEQDIFEKFQKVLRLGQQSPRATNFDSKSMQSLLITKGSVTNFQEEAVVFTNNCNLELKGVVGQVLTKQAGPELKKECDALKKPIEFGSVIATKGHSLKAKYILHAILQSRGTSSEEPEKVLRKIAVKCLDECTRLKVKSLSMTSIGAGKLGYPNDIVAKALLEETAIYLKKNKGNTTIELVRFVIYEQTVYDEFNKVYQQLNAVATKRKEFSLSQSHPLKLELLEGEIGNNSSDVTVTYDAAASLVEKKPLMKLIQNSGGVGKKMTLPVAFHQSAHEQKKFSFACLDKAEKDQFESIVFPAQFQSHAIVPKAIVDASQKFVATNPIHMKVISVLYTTLSPEIVQHYEEALKSGFLSKAKAFRSAVASAVGYSHERKSYFKDTPTLESEVVLDIFGKTKEAILKAEQQIRETVKDNFIDLKIEDKHIATLSAEGLHEISSIAASSNVKIGIDQERGIITFHGFQDVHKVRSDIQNILQKISEAEVRQTLADTLYQSIRWVQMPSSGNEEEYDEILNYEIEEAYQRKEKVFFSTEHNFVIDFTKMTDRDLTTNATARVKRIKIDVLLPEIWSPMPLDQGKEKFFHLVQLPPTSPEYIGVERAFTQTMTRGQQYTEILSIKRIQIPALYKQYALAKEEMDKRNPVGHINERHLWHGTNRETIEKINTQGFNRSFAGKHATAFGKGVYFATDSAYSHKYADPGVNKHRYMFYVQVLTGEYTRGDTNTIVPPMKPNQQNPAVLYDSTVNDINKPTIFVVYKDTQNYPAYLVQYR